MQENYLVSIVGTQEIDGEKDQIELTTVGTYVRKGNSRYIVYHEFNQDLPAGKVTSVLKVEDDKRVTLIRSGGQRSRLVLEKGKRHLCHYDTGFGSLMVGVFAQSIHSDLTDSGGTLDVSYSLDINSGLNSMNSIFVDVKRNAKKS